MGLGSTLQFLVHAIAHLNDQPFQGRPPVIATRESSSFKTGLVVVVAMVVMITVIVVAVVAVVAVVVIAGISWNSNNGCIPIVKADVQLPKLAFYRAN